MKELPDILQQYLPTSVAVVIVIVIGIIYLLGFLFKNLRYIRPFLTILPTRKKKIENILDIHQQLEDSSVDEWVKTSMKTATQMKLIRLEYGISTSDDNYKILYDKGILNKYTKWEIKNINSFFHFSDNNVQIIIKPIDKIFFYFYKIIGLVFYIPCSAMFLLAILSTPPDKLLSLILIIIGFGLFTLIFLCIFVPIFLSPIRIAKRIKKELEGNKQQ